DDAAFKWNALAVIAGAAAANGDRNAKFRGSSSNAAYFVLILRNDDEIADIMADILGEDGAVPEIILRAQFDLLRVIVDADSVDFGAECGPVIDALWCGRIHGVLRLNFCTVAPDNAAGLRTADEIGKVFGIVPYEAGQAVHVKGLYALAANKSGGQGSDAVEPFLRFDMADRRRKTQYGERVIIAIRVECIANIVGAEHDIHARCSRFLERRNTAQARRFPSDPIL